MPDYLPVFTSPEGEAIVKNAYQRTLEQWTAPYEEKFIPTTFGDIHVIASGPIGAPPVILLHAYFATAAVWYPNVGALSKNYRVYAVDILGEANLSRPLSPVTTFEEIAQWFGQMLDALDIQQADLVGNSFGGFLAATLAMLIPQRIRKIVMIGPAATFHQIFPFYINIFLPKMIAMMAPRLPGHAKRLRRGVNWMYAGLPRDAYWDELFYQVMVHGTVTNRVFPRIYSAEEFIKIATVPALLLIGDHERIYRPQETIRIAKQYLPKLETAIVPNGHHITALSSPNASNQRIIEFLNKE